MPHSTITVRSDIKDQLALLKGSRSWDAFMEDVIAHYPADEAIAELEQRIEDLRQRRVEGVPWKDVKAKRAKRAKRRA